MPSIGFDGAGGGSGPGDPWQFNFSGVADHTQSWELQATFYREDGSMLAELEPPKAVPPPGLDDEFFAEFNRPAATEAAKVDVRLVRVVNTVSKFIEAAVTIYRDLQNVWSTTPP